MKQNFTTDELHCLRFLANYPTTLNKWIKVFKNGQSKICGRQPLTNLRVDHITTNFLKTIPQILFGPFLSTLTAMLFKTLVNNCFLSVKADTTAVLLNF